MTSYKKLRCCAGVLFLSFLGSPLTVQAQLSGPEREKAQSMIAGTLYLRLDVPCRYGRGRFGIMAAIHHVESVLEVSPDGFSVEHKLAMPPRHRRDRVFWGMSPNDAVRYGKLLFKDDTVQVWMEGMAPDAYEILIDFIHIENLNDFTAAFNRTFSKVPLQDEHPEWPAEIRQAIAARKIVAGMTFDQAFCVVGAPLKTLTSEENGVKTEIWFSRQDRSVIAADSNAVDTPTGFPARLKFVDGKLQVIG
ncbi:MAG: hypothetical protein ABSC77_09050 [Terracidiphilus sp.]